MRKFLATSVLFATASFNVSAEECGKVTIADMNWNSATLIANVDKFILQHGFDCDAELVPGDTMPTGTSMIEKGEPDIAPELWSNSMKTALDRGVKEGRLRYAGATLSDGGEEGFWYPPIWSKKIRVWRPLPVSRQTESYLSTLKILKNQHLWAARLVGIVKLRPVTSLMPWSWIKPVLN